MLNSYKLNSMNMQIFCDGGRSVSSDYGWIFLENLGICERKVYLYDNNDNKKCDMICKKIIYIQNLCFNFRNSPFPTQWLLKFCYPF